MSECHAHEGKSRACGVLTLHRFTKQRIHKAPQNQSSWNYLRGTIAKAGLPLSSMKEFVQRFANLDETDNVHSSHALDLLAEIYSQEEGQMDKARKAYELLADSYDPIRARYWNYRKSLLAASA